MDLVVVVVAVDMVVGVAVVDSEVVALTVPPTSYRDCSSLLRRVGGRMPYSKNSRASAESD